MIASALEPLLEAKMASLDFSIRSEEHTSELQSLTNLVCRLLLEKKKHMITQGIYPKNSHQRNHTDNNEDNLCPKFDAKISPTSIHYIMNYQSLITDCSSETSRE